MIIGPTYYKLRFFSLSLMTLVFPHPSTLLGIFQLLTYLFEDNAVQ